MCGRFTLAVDPADLQEAFPGVVLPAEGLRHRYNIAPSQPVAVIVNAGEKRLDFYLWGLIPSWAKDPAMGSRLINARAETLAEKPAFRAAFRRRRCLIPADGFYEWKAEAGNKGKIPMYVHLRERRPFALAGLWEIWTSPDGSEVRTCAIITTRPNALMQSIHDRMPVILPPAAYEQWLDPGEQRPERLAPLLIPYPAEEMVAYPVSRLVNSPQNDSPACIEPVK